MCYTVQPTHLQLMCHAIQACVSTNGIQQLVHILPPQSFPQKSADGKSQSRLKRNSNEPSSENFLTIGGYFECNTYHVTALG